MRESLPESHTGLTGTRGRSDRPNMLYELISREYGLKRKEPREGGSLMRCGWRGLFAGERYNVRGDDVEFVMRLVCDDWRIDEVGNHDLIVVRRTDAPSRLSAYRFW